jgi:hypothetical protein
MRGIFRNIKVRALGAKCLVSRNRLYRPEEFYCCLIFNNKNSLPTNNRFCSQSNIYGVSYLHVGICNMQYFCTHLSLVLGDIKMCSLLLWP